MSQELYDYIRHQRQAKVSDAKIKKALLDAGWSQELVSASMQANLNDGQMHYVSAQPKAEKELPDVGALLSETWNSYTSKFFTYFGFLLLVIVIFIAIFAAFVFGGGAISLAGGFPAMIIIGLIGFVSAIFLQSWLQGAFIYLIDSQGKASFGEVFSRSFQRIGPIVWISVLSGFIVLGSAIPLFIPIFFFSVITMFAMYIVILEDERGVNALLKAREYIRDRFWAVLGRIAVLMLIAIGIDIMAQLLHKEEGLLALLGALISIAVTPFYSLYAYKLYMHVRAVNHGKAFVPTSNERTGYIILAAWGLVVTGLLIAMSAWAIRAFASMGMNGLPF